MPILPKRAFPWVFVFAIVALTVAGIANEAAAQVFQGPLDFADLPALTMTVTLNPGGAASYRVTTLTGSFIDAGFLVASVSGSSVIGFFQTTTFPNVRPCEFQGTYDGSVANLILDPVSCGAGGTLTLTRIA